MYWKIILCLFAALSLPAPGFGAATYEPSSSLPPKPIREFRGVWVATVANIDWPSKPGLSVSEQKRELLTILNHTVDLKLNAVIFQVRPACDAMYASSIEPWSEYLTGRMGQAPAPFYDPLAFAVSEAHKRGLELHAWFNPYRAHHFKSLSAITANHISRTRPQLVKSYGKYLWLDPGEPEVQDYSLSVVMDVVKRYDIDGVHFDDYFYPDRDDAGVTADFPDDASWRRFGQHSGLSRDDWRRENVDGFVQRVYKAIKANKPWVKFGIGPFGIWRPGYPSSIHGMDAYGTLYADSRKWLQEGWVDYFTPQLYWQIGPPAQSFPTLLTWWSEQNLKHRHLWPGLGVYQAKRWKPDEIQRQIALTRQQSGVSGYVLYSMSKLETNVALKNSLGRDLNASPALVPPSPWLGAAPEKPRIVANNRVLGSKLSWSPGDTNSVIRWWVIQTKAFNDWKTEIVPAATSGKVLDGTPESLAVTAIDRAGNASAASVLELKQEEKKAPARKPPPAPKY
jgi:uncharacterized lipoprotein YddW (UPF0748 family)